MYELTCPQCHHQMRTPYVRDGAVATCRRCGHSFAVEASHYIVVRQAKTPVSVGAPRDSHVPPGPVASDTTPPSQYPQPGESTGQPAPDLPFRGFRGFRGRIEVVQHQPPRPPQRRAGNTPPRRLSRRQAWSTLIWLTALLVLAVTTVVLAFEFGPVIGPMIANWGVARQNDPLNPAAQYPAADSLSLTNLNEKHRADNGQRLAQPPAGLGQVVQQAMEADRPQTSSRGKLRTFDVPLELLEQDIATLPRAQTQPVVAATWRLADEPFLAPVHIGPIEVKNSKLTAVDSGRLLLTAEVVGTPPHLYPQAKVALAMANFDHRVIARVELPTPMLRADRPQRVELLIPSRFAAKTMQVTWTVPFTAPVPPEQVIENILLEPNEAGPDTVLRLIVYNSTDQTYPGAQVLVAALDPQGRALAQWWVYWKKPIQPLQRVAFTAATPLQAGWDVRSWDAIGISPFESVDTDRAQPIGDE